MLRALLERRVELALLSCLFLCGMGVHRVNLELEDRTEVARATGDVGPLPDGRALRVLALGFDRLIADLFWLRTVYYVGDETSQAAGFPAVERLALLVTDIDPSFRTVYVVMSGAIGALKADPDGAIALLEKGIRHIEYWKLHFLLGFNYFIERLDYASAAEQMRIAAGMGGPPYLPLLSARLYAQAGDPATALAFIQARLAEETHPETRKALEKRYWDLWITRDLQTIDAATAEFHELRGELPAKITDLIDAGLIEREPRDPQGGGYEIQEGRAKTELPYERLEVHHTAKPLSPGYRLRYERLKARQGGER